MLVSDCLGTTIAHFRTGAKLSQEELAFRAGLHRTYISLVERGKRKPTMEAVERIAIALNLELDELIDEAIRQKNLKMSRK
jgi:transcriptional regulator with XRE-family HTH domain